MFDVAELAKQAAHRRQQARAGRSFPVGEKSRAALAAAGDPDGATPGSIAFPKGTVLSGSGRRLLDLAEEAKRAG